MQIETEFGCNGIILISAPRNGEEGIARRLSEDLDQLTVLHDDIIFRHVTISNKEELTNLFHSLRAEMKNGFRPILHFDMHGDKEKGLEIGASGEMVDWGLLNKSLQELNQITKNNLGIIILACYGFYAIKCVSILEPCPFFIMIAPPETITFGEIESSIVPFYTELFCSNRIDSARAILGDKYGYFHSDRLFFISFSRYIRNKCTGKGGRERREQLLTETITEKKLNNSRYMRRQLRKSIKSHISPTPQLMERYSSRFLHGKDCSVTFAEVMEAVKKSYT